MAGNWKDNDLSAAPIIAVVDDDFGIRDALFDLISSLGYHAQLYASGDEFLRSSNRGEIDVVISDYRMPGISGLDLQSRLTEEGASCAVILMTSYYDEQLRSAGLAAGAIGFLHKPFRAEALISHITEALRGK